MIQGWLRGEDGRRAAEDQIEEQVASFTSSRDRDELFHALQAAGITAQPTTFQIVNTMDHS